jgi:DNA-binding response OmpR family regulator
MSDDLMDTSGVARVIALHADVEPYEYMLDTSICTIGRSTICRIVVERSVVSRLHARITRDGLRYLLSDAGSANGTFVNGRKINEPHILKDRDLIGLGAAQDLLRFVDPDPTFIPSGRLVYNEPVMSFLFDGQALDLSPAQHRLLLHLYRNIGSMCTRESCAEALWGSAYAPGADADALDRAISKLRQKLRRIDRNATLIETRRTLGYILNV